MHINEIEMNVPKTNEKWWEVKKNDRDDLRVSIVGKHDTHVVGRVLATVRMELALNATTFKALVDYYYYFLNM